MRRLVSVGSLTTLLACSEPEQDPVCPSSSGEFGLVGCAVLEGQIFGNLGQGLSDVNVSMRALRPCSCTQSGGETDSQGRFRFTVEQFEASETDDTLSVMVRAAATGEQYPQPTPTTFVTDSVEVLLTFKPVGAIPDTTVAEITLHIP